MSERGQAATPNVKFATPVQQNVAVKDELDKEENERMHNVQHSEPHKPSGDKLSRSTAAK